MCSHLAHAKTVLLGAIVVLCELGSSSIVQAPIPGVDMVIPDQRRSFVPGEPIEITVGVHNASSVTLVRPRVVDWDVEVRDQTGADFEDFASPGASRFWAVGETEQTPDFSTIEPGATWTQTLLLQNRFRLHEEGEYTAIFAVDIAEIVGDGSQPFGPFFQIESATYSFEITRTPVAWEKALGPLVFYVLDEGGVLSLRFYRTSLGSMSDPIFSDHTVVGEIDLQQPVPDLIELAAVTERRGRVGVRFVTSSVPMCAVVDIEDDLIHFDPAMPIDITDTCPPQ